MSDRRVLLRSIFVSGTDPQAAITRNIEHLVDAGVRWDTPQWAAIARFVTTFWESHGHAPSIATLKEHFTNSKEYEVFDQLVQIEALQARTQGDFEAYLAGVVHDQETRSVIEVLKEAGTIISTGLDIKDAKGNVTRLLGHRAAVDYFAQRAGEVIREHNADGVSLDIFGDANKAWETYLALEADPTGGCGQHSFFRPMDEALDGVHRGELWCHAGFVGHGKSTLALNWAYNQAVVFRHSCVYVSLEMPREQMQRLILAMHSLHPRFQEMRTALGLPGGISTRAYQSGELGPSGKQLLRAVVDDLRRGVQSGEYGRIHLEVPDAGTSKGFSAPDLRQRAERLHRHDPVIATVFVDHAALLDPRKWTASPTTNQNEIARDLKRLAMSFNRGRGIAVVTLWQISREGWKTAAARAEKKERIYYSATALSWANEIERSSDVITAGWLDDDLRKQGRLRVECLKSRDAAPFDPFTLQVDWPTRRILPNSHTLALAPGGGHQGSDGASDADLEAASATLEL